MSDNLIDLLAPHTLKTLKVGNPRISSTSNWSSDVWVFDDASPGKTEMSRGIRWNLPCGPELVERFRLLAAHAFIGRAGMKTFKGTSAPQFLIGARFLAAFMDEKGMEGFDGLTKKAFTAYRRKIEGRLESLEDADDDEDDAAPAVSDANWDGGATFRRATNDLSHSQAFVRLRVWKLAVDLARDLRAGGAGGPGYNPFATTRLSVLAGKLSSHSDERIPPLPDEVAMPLLNDAHMLIETPAEDVLRLHADVITAIDAHQNGDAEAQRPLELIRNFGFSPIGKEERPWREPITVVSDKRATGGKLAVRHLITLIRDAAIIVILGDTGMRMGELCSVEVEPREPGAWDGLPSCVSVETSQTELSELFFVHGLLTKGKDEPVEEKWLVGSRPVGATWEPPAVRAVRVLERLLEPWRSLTNDEWLGRQLLVNLTVSAQGLAHGPQDVIAMLQENLVRSMREYVAERINPTKLLEPLMPNEELQPYWEKDGRCIRPHQWRKTFLRYMIRADDGLLPAVSQHFKHYTLAVTEQGYFPDDPALIEEVNSVRRRETVRFMYERRHGTGRTAARLDKTVERSRDQLVELIGDLPKAQAEPILDRFVAEHDLDIWFSSHGRCLIALDPDMARCRAHEEDSGVLVRSPNVLTRTPTMCAGCANFSVGREAAGFWRTRYVQNQTAWIESGHIRTFRVARARAKQAAAVLRALGEPLPTLLAKRREAA